MIPLDKIRINTNGCWLWEGAIDGSGYSNLGRPPWRGHRLSYQEFCGPIPAKLEIDHLCRVKSCVNPMHLEAVTHAENQRRMMAAARLARDTKKYGHKPTHCIRGHAFVPANTRKRNGHRWCKTCDALHARVYRAARRLKLLEAFS